MNQSKLKELLHYNPETGEFKWIKPAPGRRSGAVGWKNTQGYLGICIEGKTYLGHRLAWLYMTGKYPENFIDHINQDRYDNRWENLRDASQEENTQNAKLHRDNKSGIHGVFYLKGKGKWRATIGRTSGDYGYEYLGQFGDFFSACCARKSAELRHGYHPNHGR